MRKKMDIGRILIPGGIVSPGDLRRIATSGHHFGCEFLHLGSRQEIYLTYPEKDKKALVTRLRSIQYAFEGIDNDYHNIVSSYPVKSLTNSRKWLTEGIYREIISSFKFLPKLKVNICDPMQGMFPLFGGNLNFIASPFDNYWYLYYKSGNNSGDEKWPVLVDSKEIALLSSVIENLSEKHPDKDFSQLQDEVYDIHEWTFRNFEESPDLSQKRFFYYEGLHHMGGNRYWLGIYERLNNYPLPFIDSLARLCNETEIGSISITPFKSILIKNIAEKDLPLWEELLGKYRINTGHSSLEMNFTLPDLDKEALKLRNYIFKYFDNNEVRSDGLVIGLHAEEQEPASILVERKSMLKIAGLELFNYYNIRYRKDFNRNSSKLITFSGYVKKRDVPEVLIYLFGKYYDQLTMQKEKVEDTHKEDFKKLFSKKLFACQVCMTIYDEEYGDPINNIPAGVAFEYLSQEYKCPVCEAPKDDYILISPETEQL